MTAEFPLAVHALVYLNHQNRTLSSEELAENICTNPARVRKVMAALKRAGFVATKEGAQGGYEMKRAASDITLEDIAHALNSKMVTTSWRSGSLDQDCMISSGMAGVMDHIYDELNQSCDRELRNTTLQDITQEILDRKKA